MASKNVETLRAAQENWSKRDFAGCGEVGDGLDHHVVESDAQTTGGKP